jgi:DNA-binding NarL/FixJ family response regulator
MLNILVIEDHALVREGLVLTLHQLEEEITVHEAATCEGACRVLAKKGDFDLLLLDLGLPGTDGMTCLTQLRKLYPSIPVVIVSAYNDANTVKRALNKGASGFVPKSYSSDRLLAALREVLAGGIFTPYQARSAKLGPYLPPTDLPPLRGHASVADLGLSVRKLEILSLLVRGMTNRDIAAHMGLSEGTVKIQLTLIFKALRVANRSQAIVAVTKYGITDGITDGITV